MPHPTDLRRILQLLTTLYFTNPRIVMKEQGVDILVCDFCQSLQPVFHWQPCRFEENIRFYTKAKLSYKLIVQKNKWEYSMRLGVTHGYAIHTQYIALQYIAAGQNQIYVKLKTLRHAGRWVSRSGSALGLAFESLRSNRTVVYLYRSSDVSFWVFAVSLFRLLKSYSYFYANCYRMFIIICYSLLAVLFM